jgi:hypothetical protein
MGMFHVGVVGMENPQSQPNQDTYNGDSYDFESL